MVLLLSLLPVGILLTAAAEIGKRNKANKMNKHSHYHCFCDIHFIDKLTKLTTNGLTRDENKGPKII